MLSVGEVSITGYLGESHGGEPWPVELGGPCGTPAAAILDRLADLAAAGASTLLVHLSSPGGLVGDGFAIADALRAWSLSRGPVVVYLHGEVCSVAPAIAAAADHVVMNPDAVIWLHSMSGPAAEAANSEMLRRLRARCSAPDLAMWLSLAASDDGQPNRAELSAPAAVSWGLADHVGSADDARRLAAALDPAPARFEATVGVKLDHSGTALKAAAKNVQIGAWTLERLLAALAASNYVPFALPSASAWKRFKEITLAGATQGRIFALSTSTAAATSDNGGRTWTARTLPAGTWAGCAYSPSLGLFVAVGTNVAASSPDGITWTARTIPAGTYYDVIWDATNGRFVAVGAAGVCATSTNGTTWAAQTLPTGDYFCVAWNGSIYAAAGINGVNPVAASSTDATTWTARTIPGAGSSRAYAAMATDGAGLFLAIGGYSGVITVCATSPDGINWTDRSGVVPTGISYQALAYGNGIFVAVGQDALFRDRVSMSPDGVNWKTASPCLASKLFAVEYLYGFLGQRNAFIVGGPTISGVATDPAGGTSLNMAP